MRVPVSTYRLQFQPGLTFREAAALVPYLDALGVTDCYVSPFLKATPGTRHGYDICNHNELNPGLGGEREYEAFTSAISSHGMGQIVDWVPNHMCASPAANPWWRDVLENGPSSIFAEFFDIDWNPIKPELKDKILLPVLGDHYGIVLERGELQLVFDAGAVWLTYGDQRLPIDPRQAPLVLRHELDALRAGLGDEHPDIRELLSILTALQNLPSLTERGPELMAERRREKEVARERLARLAAESPHVAAHIAKAVQAFNGVPGVAASVDALHDLLEGQAYRLAYWRTASDEINYRRFFDINELAGLRMENPRVFEATHSLLLRLVRDGIVTGIRVDHPDGLFDPATYFDRLQEAAMQALAGTLPADLCPADGRDDALRAWRTGGGTEGGMGPLTRPLYVVAEKILSPGESLPGHWAIHGTTGYDFLNDVNGLFVDGGNAGSLQRTYARITGRRDTFKEVVYQSRRLIILTAMASQLAVLAHALNKLSERSRRCRDFTLNSFRKILVEVVACLPVYRTYVSEGGASASDHAAIGAAIGEARRRNPVFESSIFEFLRGVLLPYDPGPAGSGSADELPVRERLEFAMRLQQFTSPAQAKGVEDTAFYRYNVLLSVNEVGGTAEPLGRTVDEFHAANRRRQDHWPLQMITTATHDTKRGEDARARLNVISEIATEWRRAVSRWTRVNAVNRSIVEGDHAPDRNDEYLFYQALIGAWPAEATEAGMPPLAPPELVDRLAAYMQKATKEAKVHTSWVNANDAYDQAVARFVRQALTGRSAARFLASFVPLQRRVARIGMCNSLAQLVLKQTSPGVADMYQGTELWDLSLVDPDNRRPVDYASRRQMLAEMSPWLDRAAGTCSTGSLVDADEDRAGIVSDLLAHWEDGRIKMFVTSCGLRLRREKRHLFLEGDYIPLASSGTAGRRIVAFARRHGADLLVVIVPRLTAALTTAERPLPVGIDAWADTRVLLPEALRRPAFRNVLTGERNALAGDGSESWLAVAEVLRVCPVALLWGGSA